MRPEERGADNRRVLFRIVSDESHPSQRIVRIDVQRVIRNAIDLARLTGADLDMVYAIAAYHDLGS